MTYIYNFNCPKPTPTPEPTPPPSNKPIASPEIPENYNGWLCQKKKKKYIYWKQYFPENDGGNSYDYGYEEWQNNTFEVFEYGMAPYNVNLFLYNQKIIEGPMNAPDENYLVQKSCIVYGNNPPPDFIPVDDFGCYNEPEYTLTSQQAFTDESRGIYLYKETRYSFNFSDTPSSSSTNCVYI